MSISLHHGYKLTLPFSKLQSTLRKLQESIKIEDTEAYLTIKAKELAYMLDTIALGDPFMAQEGDTATEITPYNCLRSRSIREQRAIRSSMGRHELDFETNVVLFPQPDGNSLALLFTEQDHVKARWEAHPGVTPYPYWDNCDPAKGISEEEWQARGKEWEEANYTDTPATSGLTFQIYGEYETPTLPDAEGILTYLPTTDQRVKLLVQERLAHAYSKVVPYKRGDSINKWLSAYRAWQNTSEGVKAKDTLTQLISDKLPLYYLLSDLQVPYALTYPSSVAFPSSISFRQHSHDGKQLGYSLNKLSLHEIRECLLHLSEYLSKGADTRPAEDQAASAAIATGLFDTLFTDASKSLPAPPPPELYQLPELIISSPEILPEEEPT
jgi:hypothetical protein